MPKLFISHITEEAQTAARLKEALVADFLGLIETFVSSDLESIPAGEQWLAAVDRSLRECSILLILCSHKSIVRPWINFEAGAASMRQVPVIPVCHAGLVPRDLPTPFSLWQGITLTDPQGLQRLYSRVAKVLSCRAPARQFDALSQEFATRKIDANTPPVPELDDDANIRIRLREALTRGKYGWCLLTRLAATAAVSEEVAARVLRADPEVRMARNTVSKVIAGLISRVGA